MHGRNRAQDFDLRDETRPFPRKGKADIVVISGRTVGRGEFELGWRWSENVKPIAGTDLCQEPHLGYIVSGRMRVVMDDRTARETGPGDVVSIRPGHDAEIIGDGTCVFIDFTGFESYAKRSLPQRRASRSAAGAPGVIVAIGSSSLGAGCAAVRSAGRR
jgi:hypothetical protein